MSNTINLLSWNVNGIRAVHRKGFLDWFQNVSPDIMALQETRATKDQVPKELLNLEGYYSYWVSAEKKGYSGVSIFSKVEPLNVREGLGFPEFDSEGRTIIAEYPNFTLLNAYFPSGTRGLERVDYKLAYNEAFLSVCEDIRATGKPIIFCGDVNIAHNEIDLTNPKQNKKNSGFLPEERAWMDKIMSMGYVDTFRHLYPDAAERYTWWTVRGTARQRNVGWRIDYVILTEDLVPNLKDAYILHDVMGSDHCPLGVELEISLTD